MINSILGQKSEPRHQEIPCDLKRRGAWLSTHLPPGTRRCLALLRQQSRNNLLPFGTGNYSHSNKLEEKRKASSSMKLPAALLESSQLPFLCAKENGCLSELKCSNGEAWKNPSMQVDQQAGTKNLSVCHTEDGWYLFCLLLMPPPSLLFPLSPFPSACLPISKVWCG